MKKTNEKSISITRARVIKAGVYDGSYPSKDFVVSGHSTGGVGGQMETMSHQVSRDAGEIPAYSAEDALRDDREVSVPRKSRVQVWQDVGELGGPSLYGPRPDLLSRSPLHGLSADLSRPQLDRRSGGLMARAGRHPILTLAVLGFLGILFVRPRKAV